MLLYITEDTRSILLSACGLAGVTGNPAYRRVRSSHDSIGSPPLRFGYLSSMYQSHGLRSSITSDGTMIY
jgi:hypothetical protein